VRHPSRMMSLDDVFSIEELKDWYDSVIRDLDWPESKPLPMSCEVKIDGLALNLIYRNGVLEQGLTRGDGVLSLERPSTDDGFAVISVPGQSPQTISVPARTLEECLSEELGRLYPDEIYSEVVSQGLDLVKPRQ